MDNKPYVHNLLDGNSNKDDNDTHSHDNDNDNDIAIIPVCDKMVDDFRKVHLSDATKLSHSNRRGKKKKTKFRK